MRTVLCFLAACGLARGADPALASKLDDLVKAHDGKAAVVVQKFGEPVAYAVNADEVMSTASLIKFPIMVEAYFQFAEGKVKASDMCMLQKDDQVPGSGVLTQHFSVGSMFTLRDAIRLMGVYSDNTATNLVLDQIGIRPVNARMAALGLPETRINSKVYKRITSVDLPRSEKYGLGSTSPNEMLKLLTLLHENKLVSAVACKEMTDIMLKCEDNNKYPRFLPPGTKVAMKTGSVNASRTAAGIIYVPTKNSAEKTPKSMPVAVCVMTDKNKDQRWVPDSAGDLLCAKIAKAVYDHFHD